MKRSVILLIGGVLVISAVSLSITRWSRVDTRSDIRNLPVDLDVATGAFIPNLGQAPNDAFFYLERDESVVLLKAASIDLETDVPLHGSVRAGLHFISANGSPRVVGLEPVGRLTGFKSVQYQGFCQGIDLTVTSEVDKLWARFTLVAGADPNLILFRAEGIEGRLVNSPTAYQVKDGIRIPVSVSFEASRYGSTRLSLGPYETGFPIEIELGLRL